MSKQKQKPKPKSTVKTQERNNEKKTQSKNKHNYYIAIIGAVALVIAAIIGIFNIDLTPFIIEGKHTPSDTIKFKHKNGKIELFDSSSGVAYIYKEFLDENLVGKIYDDNKIVSGWAVKLYLDNDYFVFFVDPAGENNFQCYARYAEYDGSTYVYTNRNYTEEISVVLTEDQEIKIEFNINNVPFDLCSSTDFKVGYAY